uniref:Putative secreted salivary peptide of 6.78 kDa n=1 Tax=Ixodes ricinus TaxID=34613 RepID=V5H0Z3_IXORI
MDILIAYIVIANVVISQGNVEEAGKDKYKIQEESLLILDNQECGYLGYTIKKRRSKKSVRSLCQMDLPGQSVSAASSRVLSPCPSELLRWLYQVQVAVGGLPPYQGRSSNTYSWASC